MIVAAYGVPGITGIELALMLGKLKVDYGIVKQNSFRKVLLEGRLKPQPIFPVIFTSSTCLLRTQGRFKIAKVVAFVVDNPVVLTRNIKVPLLGAEATTTGLEFSHITEGVLRSLLIENANKEEQLLFSDHKYQPIKEILKKYEQSDLSKIQTFLYKIKEVDKRDRVSRLIKTWLLTAAPLSKIESRLQKEIKPAIVDNLRAMLCQPSVDNLRVAIRQVKQNKLTPTKAAKKYKISAFDLRYLIATK